MLISASGCEDSTERPEPRTDDWAPPGIAWEEDLDVRADLALACGKSAPGQYGTCNSGNITS